MPCGIHNMVKQFARILPAHGHFGFGVNQIVLAVFFYRAHKFLGNAHGDIKVGDIGIHLFAIDKIQNIGMIHAQNAHVCAAARAALLNGLGGHVKHAHKADRPTGNAACRIYRCAVLAQARKRKACAPARFMYQRRIFYRFKNGVHAVLNGQHKASRKLPQRAAGIHQSRRVWQKAQRCHCLKKLVGARANVGVLVISRVCRGNMRGYTPKHALYCFYIISRGVLCKIPLFQYLYGVFSDVADHAPCLTFVVLRFPHLVFNNSTICSGWQ